MTKEEIIEAIRTATCGTFIGPGYGISTLMGWTPEYDAQGRQVNCDPNYRDSHITIEGVEYPLTRHGWTAIIWKPENVGASYGWVWKENFKDYALAVIDLQPDFSKTYYENKEYRASSKQAVLDEPSITSITSDMCAGTLEAINVNCEAVVSQDIDFNFN